MQSSNKESGMNLGTVEELGFAVDYVAAWLKGRSVWVLVERGTLNLVGVTFADLLYVVEDAKAKVYQDDQHAVSLVADPDTFKSFHDHLIYAAWSCDPLDYDSTPDQDYLRLHEDKLIAKYGRGAWAVIARGQLIAVCVSAGAALDIADEIPTAIRSVICLGYGLRRL